MSDFDECMRLAALVSQDGSAVVRVQVERFTDNSKDNVCTGYRATAFLENDVELESRVSPTHNAALLHLILQLREALRAKAAYAQAAAHKAIARANELTSAAEALKGAP